MVPILLFISFIIHIVLLVVVWQLAKQLKTLKNNQPEDIMDIFETYLEEFKEENRLLQSKIVTKKQFHKTDTSKRADETSNNGQTSDLTYSKETKPDSNETYNNEQLDIPNVENDVTLSLEANVLHLYSQGYTVEEIARKLNSGKTEVMLIVKFHNQNEQ